MTYPRLRKTSLCKGKQGFSLIELLTVIAIIGVISTLTVIGIGSIKRSTDLKKAGADIAGVLEQARTYAMAHNTYTWVGFSQKSPDLLVIGAIASKNADSAPSGTDADGSNADVVPLAKLRNVENAKLIVATSSTNRPSVDAGSQLASLNTAILSFSVGVGAKKTTFDKHVVQFNSRGEAQIAKNSIQRLIEIGVGSSLPAAVDSNYVAVQIGGLSGSVTTYQP